MSVEIQHVDLDGDILKKIVLIAIEARLLCDYFMNHNNRSARGNCAYYATVLRSFLAEQLPDYNWCLDGGWELGSDNDYVDEHNLPGGMISDYSDEYESHYWVICSELNIICDTSSSQFGTGDIFITNKDNGIYNSNLDSDMIESEIKYDSKVLPYNDEDIENIKDPEKRFEAVVDKIFSMQTKSEFLEWKQDFIQDYLDDLNDYVPSLKFKI